MAPRADGHLQSPVAPHACRSGGPAHICRTLYSVLSNILMDTSPKFSSFISFSELFPRWNVSVYSNLKSDLPEDASVLGWLLGLTPRIAMEADSRHLVPLPCAVSKTDLRTPPISSLLLHVTPPVELQGVASPHLAQPHGSLSSSSNCLPSSGVSPAPPALTGQWEARSSILWQPDILRCAGRIHGAFTG